jgi:CheY-like chemotaxis protein
MISDDKPPLSKYSNQRWAGKLVLIVEDTIDNYLYLKILLTGHGLLVLHAASAAEAMDQFKANPDIELVLMDIQLPDDSGLNLTKTLKRLNPDLVIIAETALAMVGDATKCREAGCDDYLSKPISAAKLLEVMGKYLG